MSLLPPSFSWSALTLYQLAYIWKKKQQFITDWSGKDVLVLVLGFQMVAIASKFVVALLITSELLSSAPQVTRKVSEIKFNWLRFCFAYFESRRCGAT